jgi:hypothetical protein
LADGTVAARSSGPAAAIESSAKAVRRRGSCGAMSLCAAAAAALLLAAATVLAALSPTGPARYPTVNNALLAGSSVVEAARSNPPLSCGNIGMLPTKMHLVCYALGTWDDVALGIEGMWWARTVAARAALRGLELTFSTTRDFVTADVIVVSNYLPRHAVLRALRRRAAHVLAVLVVGENADASHYADHYLGDVDVVFGYSRALAAAAPDRFARVPSWMIDWVPPETCTLDALRTDDGAAAWRARPYFASFVARHAPPPRPQLVAALAAVGPVLCPGRALHNSEWPAAALANVEAQRIDAVAAAPIGNKLTLNRATRFVVSPENSAGDGYVTEKVADALVAGAVPVYWGGDLPPDPDVFNPARILLYAPNDGANSNSMARAAGAFATPEALAARAAELDTDPIAAQRFFDVPALMPWADAATARTCDAVTEVFLCALGRQSAGNVVDDNNALQTHLRSAKRRRGGSHYAVAAAAALVDAATDFLARDPFHWEWRSGN